MATGYDTILTYRRIEKQCADMGLQICGPKHGWNREYGAVLAVRPLDDALPIYSRDVELFIGSLEELEIWLRGAEWMHTYYALLKIVDNKKIQKKEDGVRHGRLVEKLRTVPVPEVEIPF